MEEDNRLPIGTIALWMLLLASLALNGFVIYTLDRTRDEARALLAFTRERIDTLTTAPIATVVAVDQYVPIAETFSISQTFVVPVDTVYPLATRINTTIQLPILGSQDLNVPVYADVPIQMEFEVPIQMEVPVSLTYHVEMDVPVEFIIPSETTRPIYDILQETEKLLR